MKKYILTILLLLATIALSKTITVFVPDSGIDVRNDELMKHVPKKYHKDPLRSKIEDTHGHGTHVSGIILKGVCKEVILIPCIYYYNGSLGYNNLQRLIKCINKATKEKAKIINLSGGGSEPSPKEREAIRKFLNTGGVFIAAAGNNGQNLDLFPYYPACYRLKGMYTVGNLLNNGKKASSSNYAEWVYWARGMGIKSWGLSGTKRRMSGTSQATANFTNKLLRSWCLKNSQSTKMDCKGFEGACGYPAKGTTKKKPLRGN